MRKIQEKRQKHLYIIRIQINKINKKTDAFFVHPNRFLGCIEQPP